MTALMYTIAAIPTRYAGVNFRSRLEARWAAFFDLAGWKWEYEPASPEFDFWIPDFRLTPQLNIRQKRDRNEVRITRVDVYCEVKPIDFEADLSRENRMGPYKKALLHSHKVWVLCLGRAPFACSSVGILGEQPPDENGEQDPDHCDDVWGTVHLLSAAEDFWREAGNAVQWRGQKIA